MVKVFMINEKGVERSRYSIGNKKLLCGFQIQAGSRLRTFNSIDEILSSITALRDTNVIQLTEKVKLAEIIISIKEIEITNEYIIDSIAPNSDFKYRGYTGIFVEDELNEFLYLTNNYPISLNGNRYVWEAIPKQTDMPSYKVLDNLGIPNHYFDLESLCGFLEDSSDFDYDDLYVGSNADLLKCIRTKLHEEFPTWNYETKKLVKNINYLTNVKIIKNN